MTITREYLKTRRRIMPNRETVTLTKYAAGVAGTSYSVENSEVPSLSPSFIQLYAASGIVIQSQDFPVILNEQDLQDAGLTGNPEPNDKVTTAAGVVGRIVNVRPELMATRYRCLCRKDL